MGFIFTTMDYTLINPTPEAIDFLTEWNDSTKDYITAHTSGSTGKPKTIHLPKTDMVASARATCRFFGLNSDSYMVCPLSASYIAGKMMIVRAIVSGAKLCFEQPSSHPLSAVSYPPIDLVPIVPAQIPAIVSSKQTIKNIIVGGAPVPIEGERSLLGMSCSSYATFGMTETCSHVALRPLGSEIYRALPGISFATDSRDCLVINAPGFSFSRLVTNDIVALIDPLSFRWIGRADNVIITGALKVHPESVEQKIASLIDLPFFIDSEPDEKWGMKIILVIEGGNNLNDSELLYTLAHILPPHERPRAIRHVKVISRTSSGKIIRRV